MKKRHYILTALLGSLIAFSGCSSTGHEKALKSNKEREFTMGVVQKEIRVGMSEAEVIESLGSPNMVTRDKQGRETWVYDKIASEASQSSSSGGFSLILFGYEKSAGAASSTQKTLTVVIKFNDEKEVDTFTYHSSKF